MATPVSHLLDATLRRLPAALRAPGCAVREIAVECGADRIFAYLVAGLGLWSALSLALLALDRLDLFHRT